MVLIENEGALFRGPARGRPTEVYVGGDKGWAPYADAGKPKPIDWGNVIDENEAKELMAELDKHRGVEKKSV
jgi:hypothetical protein